MDFAKVVEFASQHWQLVGSFVGVLGVWFVYETRKQGQTVSPQQLVQYVNRDNALVIDLRDAKDYKRGHITGSRHIAYIDFKNHVDELKGSTDKPVILVCGLGQYAGAAGKILHQAGFKNVLRLSGGVNAWSSQGLPLVASK